MRIKWLSDKSIALGIVIFFVMLFISCWLWDSYCYDKDLERWTREDMLK